jgi:DHA1 family multidrug resistance protein-like MFS transporter
MNHWKRTLAFTATAQMVSIIGFNFFTPFLPLFLPQLGMHGVSRVTLWAALLSGGSAIAMALSAPFWGILADRHGRKIMLVRATFSAAVLIGLSGLVQNVYELLFLRILQGAFTGTVTASQALVSSQSPRERMGFSLGIMQTAIFLGVSIGPLLGGLAADAVGYRLSFAMAGGVLFSAGLLVLFFVEEERMEVRDEAQSSARIWMNMRAGLATPGLLPVIGAIFAVQFGLTVVVPVLPQFVEFLQGPGGHAATVTGLIFTGGGIAGAISSLAAGSLADRLGYKRVIVVASVIAAIFSVPQFFVNATWQLLLLRIGMGFAMGAIMPSASALLGNLVPPEKRGTAYGLSGSATSLGFAAGPLTAAGVVSIGGIRPVFLTASVLLLAIAVWVQVMVVDELEDGSAAPWESASVDGPAADHRKTGAVVRTRQPSAVTVRVRKPRSVRQVQSGSSGRGRPGR